MATVEIYTRRFCPFCTKAKDLLDELGQDYTEHDAGADPELKAEMVERSDGAATFPQIFINDAHIGGCDDMVALHDQGKLEPLLNEDGDLPEDEL